jgi:hypothetical protein
VAQKIGEKNQPKNILYWNEAYGSTEYGFCCGQKPYETFQCIYKNCYATNNRSHLESVDQFDAILFHQRSLDSNDLPGKRKPHQKYIMYMMESASYPFNFVRYVNDAHGGCNGHLSRNGLHLN